jgi:hypothetical protein
LTAPTLGPQWTEPSVMVHDSWTESTGFSIQK